MSRYHTEFIDGRRVSLKGNARLVRRLKREQAELRNETYRKATR